MRRPGRGSPAAMRTGKSGRLPTEATETWIEATGDATLAATVTFSSTSASLTDGDGQPAAPSAASAANQDNLDREAVIIGDFSGPSRAFAERSVNEGR